MLRKNFSVVFCVMAFSACGGGGTSSTDNVAPTVTLAPSPTNPAPESIPSASPTPEPMPSSTPVATSLPTNNATAAPVSTPPPAEISPELRVVHAGIVDSLSNIDFALFASRIQVEGVNWAPLFWGPGNAVSTGNDPMGYMGSLPSPAVIGNVGNGRVAVFGHEGFWSSQFDQLEDNDEFRVRVLRWLLNAGRSVKIADGHAEWLTLASFSPTIVSKSEQDGVLFSALSEVIDERSLSDTDLLVFGNPWGSVAPEEIAAIDAWVRSGGSLLVTGVGWSWASYKRDPNAVHMPVNILGEELGFRIPNGVISNPSNSTSVALMPLDEYRPSPLRVLRGSAIDQVAERSDQEPYAKFVIEGQYMGLMLPNGSWETLKSPRQATAALDAVYEAQIGLAGGERPFGGAKVWVLPQAAPNAHWWMHAGNPIIYKSNAAEAEIVPRLNSEGHPGWGVAHENGHNMHNSVHGDIYVADGTGEMWPNIFGLVSYRDNDWDFYQQMGEEFLNVGYAYHASESPNFSDWLADPFVPLGCFDLLIKAYGWEGMERFLTQATMDYAAGREAGGNEDRLAYLVEKLSSAYSLDFSPTFRHWGYSVTSETSQQTAQFPVAQF